MTKAYVIDLTTGAATAVLVNIAAAQRALFDNLDVSADTAAIAEPLDLISKAPAADLSGPQLVRLYNVLAARAGKPETTRFASRTDGADRVFALIEALYGNQAPEAAAPPSEGEPAVESNPEGGEDMTAKKVKKARKLKSTNVVKAPKAPKAAKAPREKAAPREKKGRSYKDEVRSKGGEASLATALEMVSRKMGATVEEIAERLGLSVGSAKNLIWYLRRAGNKIVRGKVGAEGRQPYVIGE